MGEDLEVILVKNTDSDNRDPLRTACVALLAELELLAEQALTDIRLEVPEYAAADVPEHRQLIVDQFRNVLIGLMSGQGPSRAASGAAFALGARRAQQHFSVQAVIAAYHVGFRILWQGLRRHLEVTSKENLVESLTRVDNILTWLQDATGAAAEGHAESVRLEEQTRSGALQRLIDLLYGGASEAPEASDAARRAGFDPAEYFRVFVGDANEPSHLELGRLNRELTQSRSGGVGRALLRNGRVVVLTQRLDAHVVAAVLRRFTAGPLGIGIERRALVGAGASVRDAEDALGYAADFITADRAECWFEFDWWDILAAPAAERLSGQLAVGVRVARENPELAETVWQHLEQRLSFTRSALALHLHPHSVRYRIERWVHLTGRGFDTTADRALARLAIRLGRRAVKSN